MSSMIYFSPTGTTEQVVRYMGQALSLTDAIDLSGDVTERRFEREDLCVVGVPSFGGRVPAIAAQRLEKIRGNQTPALLVVTYGGRAYEDTLIELKDILESHNFVCIGAAAVVAAHSIAPRIAAGRPNKRDFAGLDNFLRDMQQRLCGAPQSVFVPGSRPYKKYGVLPMDVQVTGDCIGCGQCADRCPVHAIPAEAPTLTNGSICISCMRCLHICPVGARTCSQEKAEMLNQKLSAIYKPELENEFFK